METPTTIEQGQVRHAERLGEALVRMRLIDEKQLASALEINARTGERLGRILLRLGSVHRRRLYSALADLWNMRFVELPRLGIDRELVKKCDPEDLAREGWIPVAHWDGKLVVATSDRPDAFIEGSVRSVLGDEPIEWVVTTDWDIRWAIGAAHRHGLLDRAASLLLRERPSWSAHTVLTPRQFFGLLGVAMILAAIVVVYPKQAAIAVLFGLNAFFIGSVIMKFVVSLLGARPEHISEVTAEEVAALDDRTLPVYTILVPVYREANVVGLLVEHLGRIDYPHEKLEILLLLEEDDHETIDAAKRAAPNETIRFIVIPDGLPKTKPKACNVGLCYAQGELIVIYDAEDRPEPDQLKKAVVAFRKAPRDLVCLQAALNYFNADENHLTRSFTLEYSFWFDCMLPGLDRLELPIPLGGTSNHFRTDQLRALGGWDPYNVTEDADLGVRAACAGYRVGVLPSTTYEEANTQVRNWIRQRSRWIKGYMQTTLVHLRNPVALTRGIGLYKVLGFSMLVGGSALSLIVSPAMWLLYAAWLWKPAAIGGLFPPFVMYASLFNLLIGNGTMTYLAMLAVFRRRQYHLIGYALLTPVYWMLQSVAAYKALWQLIARPHYWEKTTHGLSRHLAPADAGVGGADPA